MVVLCTPAQAAQYFVNTVEDTPDATPADGLCADSAGRCSLRAAVMEANVAPAPVPAIIHLPAGDFLLALAGTGEDAAHSGDLDILHPVTVIGAGPALTRIDGAAQDRVFEVHAGATLRLRRLAVLNGQLDGSASGGGAGVRVGDSAALHLQEVEVAGHRMRDRPGGIALDVRGCVQGRYVRIRDNGDKETPAAAGSVTIRVGSQPGDEGACLLLDDSEISGNSADAAGAIQAGPAGVVLRRSLLSGNTASGAGALQLAAGVEARLENVTISGNRGDPGAVLVAVGARVEVQGSTVTANGPRSGTASQVGGIRDLNAPPGQTSLANSILAGNGPGLLADDCAGVVSSGGGNHYGDCSGLQSLPNDRLEVAVALGPLGDHGGFTRSHLPHAQAIDDGWAAGCLRTDQRGQPRAFDHDGDDDPGCDVGAVEMQSPQPTFTVNTPDDSADILPGDGHCDEGRQRCSLRAAIHEANARPGVDIVALPPGIFVFGLAGQSEDAAATGDLDVTDDLVLLGAGSALTTIDAGALDRVIDVHDVGGGRHVALRGVPLRNGRFAAGAGLQVAAGAQVDLEDIILRDHRSDGPVAATALAVGGRVSGRHVRILGNVDEGWGATIAVGTLAGACDATGEEDPDATLDLEDCEISGNVALLAGALSARCGRTVLRRCLVAGNQGGAMSGRWFSTSVRRRSWRT
ncbi:choice-of-anchor Q domain-containing protein [Pseudofulvimonas gallinarii]|uniref:choice-of-anchor Q domain-containing protein n=1 Tax=Pseudofulvimonas gallinarii TaxID=634155 RepID=UPI002440F602|nr:choice-of-anchor Q domain-containing protein [Pseudofulvimonas gallinarii]